MIEINKKELMRNKKFKEAYYKLSGKYNRERNKIRKRIVRKMFKGIK